MSERLQRAAFEETLQGLVVTMRADFDTPTWKLYWIALKDVKPELLMAAVTEAAKTMKFMPKPVELRTLCEVERRRQLALEEWTPCVDCQDTPRRREFTKDGMEYSGPCPCLKVHRAKLERLGLTAPICQLPSTANEGPAEQDYPTRDQLPEGVQDRLDQVRARQVLR